MMEGLYPEPISIIGLYLCHDGGTYLELICVIGLYLCHDGGTLSGTHQCYWIVFVP
jgi:hypothetical protein